jgi:branched-chain amino acid transport system substrate-binding protein
MKTRNIAVVAAVVALVSLPALAEITIGVTVAATGPAAALGGPQRNTASLFPTSIAGEKIRWVVLDDATDPSAASKNASRFVNEEKVDLILGSSTVANTLAVTEVAVEAKTPLIAPAPVDLPPAKDKWVFRTAQHNSMMAKALVDHMKARGIKTLGFIGFADPYGESWLKATTAVAEAAGIKLATVERYNRADTSVTAQALKLIAARPDAVLIVGSGTPAALPHTTLTERGYKGAIYQTHGAPSKEFLKVGGKAVESGVYVVGPLLVWNLLPDSAETKKPAMEYAKKYEEKFGAGTISSFGGHLWDAWLIAERALPAALKKAKPGTEQFRSALRDAIEGERDIAGVHGVFNMTARDHFGHDDRARLLVQPENGVFKLVSGK